MPAPFTSDTFLEAVLCRAAARGRQRHCVQHRRVQRRDGYPGHDSCQKTSLEIGKALFASDFFIAVFAGGLYGVRTGLYCVLGLLAKAFVVDGVIESINVRKKVTIVSSSPERITAFIRDSLHRGATIYDARGAYTGREEHVITTVLKRREAVLLRNFIRRADPKAFITIVNSSGNHWQGVPRPVRDVGSLKRLLLTNR